MEKYYHTLYIPLPESSNQELFKLYKHLNNLFPNTFLNEKSWLAHITIISLQLYEYDTDLFVDKSLEVLNTIEPFTIDFDNFGLSQSKKFVVLELSPDTIKYLQRIKNKINDSMAALIRDNIPDKYTNNWEKFNPEQKNLIITTGSKYEYIPHVSIIKLPINDSFKALQETIIIFKNQKLEKHLVNKLDISVESGDFDRPFRIISEIGLGCVGI